MRDLVNVYNLYISVRSDVGDSNSKSNEENQVITDHSRVEKDWNG